MKIAHISDLHLDSVFRKENIEKTKFLFNYLREERFDHVVITGDISHNANKDDYITLRAILNDNDFLRSEKCTVIIGNHDIFGGVITAEDVLEFPSKCRETDYNAKVKEFYNYFSELFETATFASFDSVFPFAKVIKNIVFFGINSIDSYSYIKNLFASNGKINKVQREAVEKLFSLSTFKDKIKVALVHHHFSKFHTDSLDIKNPLWNRIEKSTMKLRGKGKILNLFNKYNIKYVMHGHVHQINKYERENIEFFNAGLAIDNYSPDKINFNFFTVLPEKLTHQIYSLPQIKSVPQTDETFIRIFAEV